MTTILWTTEKRKISDLIPAKYNPRKSTEEEYKQLEQSLDKFSLADPLVINANNTVIGGHFRLKILQTKNINEIDCRVPSRLLDEHEERELNLRLNKNLGLWDYDGLADFDEEMLKDIGFDSKELDKIFQLESSPEDDDVPENPPAIAKRGDIYQLGDHRVMCGDSTSADDVAHLMQGKKADMVFTDPPYKMDTIGGGLLKNSNSMKQIRKNNVDTFNPESLLMFSDVNIFFHNKPLIKKYIELSEKWDVSYDLCFYKKENITPNYSGHLMTDVEYISIIGKQSPRLGLDKEFYSKCFIGKKDLDNKLSYSKPVALCEKFIFLFSDRKKIVLDLFLGSGSTLIACEKTSRICYGIEIDPHYVDVIIERWEKYTGKKSERISENVDSNNLVTAGCDS